MRYNALFLWALALPTTLAVEILSTTSTTEILICSTKYASKSPFGAVPTATITQTIEKKPQILHTTVVPTKTVTPKPFITKTTDFEELVVFITATPEDGTWTTTSTQFDTSTFWHHSTVTETSTVYITGTTRKTTWIPAPTGFIPVRNTTSGIPNEKVDKLQAKSEPSKVQAKKPLASRYPVAVKCTNVIKVYTKETMVFVARDSETTTIEPVTLYKTTSIVANLTSTILSIPTGTVMTTKTTASSLYRRGFWGLVSIRTATSSSKLPAVTGTRASTGNANPRTKIPSTLHTTSRSSGPLTADVPLSSVSHNSSDTSSVPAPSPGQDEIVTLSTSTVMTPYTVTKTWMGTVYSTFTSTLHATTTTTSYAACATANLLYKNHSNQRINAVNSNVQGYQILHVMTGVTHAHECCVACITKEDFQCAYSLFQLEGEGKNKCLLYEVQSSEDLTTKKKKSKDKCGSQAGQMGVYAFREDAGEVAYVASNGLCGFISDFNLIFPVE
ncbi:hypothetical protein MBLNU459_g4117t1 [Dothideomycetes sp. NU459]